MDAAVAVEGDPARLRDRGGGDGADGTENRDRRAHDEDPSPQP
jgi:hypothetical protein